MRALIGILTLAVAATSVNAAGLSKKETERIKEAATVLKGAPPSAIPAASPRKVFYALNLTTAQQMKITFSDQLVRGARHTFTGDK